MLHHSIQRWMSRRFVSLPLQAILIVPILLQVLGTVSVVGYLSWRSGQLAVNNLANQLIDQASDRTWQHLEQYTNLPPKITGLLVEDLEAGQISLDGKNLSRLDRYFLSRSRAFPEASFIYVGTESGQFIGAGPLNRVNRDQTKRNYLVEVADDSTGRNYVSYPINADNQRKPAIETTPNYHPRQRPWYQLGIASAKPVWTDIYTSIGQPNPGLTITHVRPFFLQGKPAGVAAVDFFLSDISQFLQTLQVSRSATVFILESDNKLVASSHTAPITANQTLAQRLSAKDHPDVIIRETFNQLQTDQTRSQSFYCDIDGQRRFVRVTPWSNADGLNWRIVVVVPESDFKAQIQTNTQSTLLLSGLALLGSLGLSYATSRWATRPIIALSQAARDLVAGKQQPMHNLSPQPSELGDLAISFNAMADRLQHSLSNLRSVNQALFHSKHRLNQLLEALPVGVMVVDLQGNCTYLNRTGQLLLGVRQVPTVGLDGQSRAYRIYRTGSDSLYPTDELPIAQALQGQAVYRDDLEIRFPHAMIPLESRAVPVVDNAGKIVYAIQTFQNITTRKQAELAHHNSEQRIQRLTDNLPGIVFRYVVYPDRQQTFTYVSRRCYELLGLQPEEILQDAEIFWRNVLPEDEAEIRRQIPMKTQAMTAWTVEYRVRMSDGSLKWFHTHTSPVRGEQGEVIWDGLTLEVTERKQADLVLLDYRYQLEAQVQERTIALQQANQELERIATLDGLTKIANRRRFDIYLDQEWQRLSRDQQPLSVILCDVDYFKLYNDCYGHQAGDYCLQLVANAMKTAIKRPADLLARYGGEEFVVLLPQTNHQGALQVAEQLRSVVQALKMGHEQSPINDYVSASVGVATVFPISEESPDKLVAAADQALYQAKQQGRNRVCVAPLAIPTATV
jgi:diguanylate cyclase (GGDEF)-like protein/PAS domain S-box-containing protein